MKKEDIYINLQGKSKEELTYLYNFLESIGEDIFRNGIEWFLKYSTLDRDYAHLSYRPDYKNWGNLKTNNKQEVTIQQLKEILQPMEIQEGQLIKEAIKRGFLTEGNKFYSCFDDRNKNRLIKPYDDDSELNLYLDNDGYLRYDDGLNNEYDTSLCSNPAIYKDGVWAEIINNNLSLEQQLEKAKAEVKRIEQEIEESKIKIGDWVVNIKSGTCFKWHLLGVRDVSIYKKITDKELINKLNNLIK